MGIDDEHQDRNMPDDRNQPLAFLDALEEVAAAQPQASSRGLARAVRFFGRKRCRLAVFLTWLALAGGGLFVLPAFIVSMVSDVPPVKGTDSFGAAAAMAHYFPQENFTTAFLCESTRGAQIMGFVQGSTCSLEQELRETEAGLEVQFSCKNSSALGGGCITTGDLLMELEKYCEAVIRRFVKDEGRVQQISMLMRDVVIPTLAQKLPNITQCPVVGDSGLDAEWLGLAANVSQSLEANFPECTHAVQSFASAPAQSLSHSAVLPFPGGLVKVDLSADLPSGTFWNLFQTQLLSADYRKMIIAASTVTCDGKPVDQTGDKAKDISRVLEKVAASTPPTMRARPSSQTLMLNAILGGVSQTMDLSTMTMPVALLILAGMAGNLRLVLCTCATLAASLASSVLIMYPVALCTVVCTTAPSMMVAVGLAMSIDYSLFLLTRFQKEISAGRPPSMAVEIMLRTSGKIVLVSGLTLLLCFLMMLHLPASFIANMGISAAVSVCTAISAALTLTPAMLLAFPEFFGSNRRWGLTRDGCYCCCRRRGFVPRATDAAVPGLHVESLGASLHSQESFADDDCHPPVDHSATVDQRLARSGWPRFGRIVQKGSLPILVALVAIAAPFGYFSLTQISYSAGLIPFMPTDAEGTHTIQALQEAFGVGTIFPTTLLVVPPPEEVKTQQKRSRWMKASCLALQEIAAAVDTDPTLPAFTAAAFTGNMILNGRCTAGGAGIWSDVDTPYSATQVMITYQIDPFSTQGQMWIQRLRKAVAEHKDVGSWYISGEGPNQMDAADVTFAAFPLMISLMMGIVTVLIGLSFKSIIAPLRAVFCLAWMLIMTFGAAIYVFQDGCLGFLNWNQLGPRSGGAMSWICPCVACSVIVGLGLDYDIFYTERVLEECEHGHKDKDAAIRALADTANTISAAGVIMAIAFGSLLLCSTPSLNEIAFFLIVGVLIDCFISTKIIMPAAMYLIGRFNFWPHRFPEGHLQGESRRGLAASA